MVVSSSSTLNHSYSFAFCWDDPWAAIWSLTQSWSQAITAVERWLCLMSLESTADYTFILPSITLLCHTFWKAFDESKNRSIVPQDFYWIRNNFPFLCYLLLILYSSCRTLLKINTEGRQYFTENLPHASDRSMSLLSSSPNLFSHSLFHSSL